jgi:hypothetical protein
MRVCQFETRSRSVSILGSVSHKISIVRYLADGMHMSLSALYQEFYTPQEEDRREITPPV